MAGVLRNFRFTALNFLLTWSKRRAEKCLYTSRLDSSVLRLPRELFHGRGPYRHTCSLGSEKTTRNCLPKIPSRSLHTTSLLSHGEYEWQDPKSPDEIVNVIFVDRDGEQHNIQGKVGDNVLYLAHRHGIEMEDDYFDKLPEATEEEEDLLDLAPFLSENSRLGCQIILSKEMEGLQLVLPKITRNFYVDGHVPQPH